MPIVCLALALAGIARTASGQELEARAYSDAPIDTNFAVATYSNSSGDVNLDTSLPLSDVRASVNLASLGLSRTFALFRHVASLAVVLPYLGANATGAVYGQGQGIARNGFPDARARFSVNLLGPALTPREFARRKPKTTLGLSLTVTAPTGTYDPTHLINIGSNRWAFKPEIGAEQPMGKWFADASAGLSIFGSNENYLQGQVLRQAPLWNAQVHAGYTFRPGQWLALDANYFAGGATTVDTAKATQNLANSRYGVTFSQPMGPGVSMKFFWSHWLAGTYGQNFTTAGVALQYRWFGGK